MKHVRFFISYALAGFVFLSGTEVLSDSFRDGLAAAQAGDYNQAYSLWLPLAESGDANSQRNIGNLHAHTESSIYDPAAAFSWWLVAANNGDIEAQNDLGHAYHYGFGTAVDLNKSLDWYKQSAVAGNSVAQANVGAAYGQGEGVDQDWAKSFYWYHRSAKQGFALGLHNLGVAFANGRGVSTDYAESYKWYILALEATPASDLIGRHLILRNIENVLKFLSPGEVDFANQIAKNWQPKNER